MIQWAIVGRHGLYYDTAPTRRQIIARHCWAVDRACFEAGYPNASRPLTANQKRAWNECKRRGDKAIKVKVTPIEKE